MTFDEILAQVLDLLQHQGRVSYRALKRRFALDDDYLEDLKVEIIKAQQLAIDEGGEVLVWTGEVGRSPAPGEEQTRGPRFTRAERPRASEADQTAQIDMDGVRRGVAEGERRQLTVLFCDLVDSTALATRLDPEEWREVVRAYQAVCAEVIGRFEGYIAQYLGDGLLVYFGYPQAHEDDPQRAVHTGLGMVEGMGRLNAHLQQDRGVKLAVRVGIHTGPVVVGEMGGGARHEALALGETPNLAARLQGLAHPDTVVISAATYRLVQGLFVCRDLGSQTLKGVATPVAVYRVLGESGVQSRLEVAGPIGLTPLVGRESEVTLLLERWAQVKDGLGQVVLLSGEAGIGKSRLVQVVKEHVSGEPHLRWECRCSPYYQNSALYPVIDLMQRALQFKRDEATEGKLSKLERALAPYRVPLPEVVPLLAALLALPLPERYPPLTLTPQRQRQKTLEAVLSVLLALAAQQPVLFIVEDLHWVDPSTLELLSLLIDQVPTARLLTLLTCRPDFQAPWGFRAHLTPLTLSRLSRPQVEVMVERVSGGKALPLEVRQQVVAKTDGVPLFVEELTKMVLESGLLQEREEHFELTRPLPPLAIPTTLHDSLMARLDRLATVKAMAQLGATLGREFAYALLQAVSPWDEETLRRGLQQLVEAELLYQQGLPPQATYLFKHALIQEAAYQSLLKSTRQRYHQQIAQAFEALFAETAETQPELLAHHYTEAGLSAQAIPYWQRAGQRAIERSAHLEAIAHLTKGLEVIATLPDTPERIQHELDFQITLGPAVMVTKGWADSEVARVYNRARVLCQQMGETPQLFPALWGLWLYYTGRGELQTARELGEQLLALAERVQDPMLLVQACHALGPTLFWLGELVPAQERLAQGVARYDPQLHRASLRYGGHDPGWCCWSYATWTLWARGYPDQALHQEQEALRLAQELAHPYTLISALHFTAWLHQFRREGQAMQALVEAAMPIVSEHGFVQLVAQDKILRGWALAAQGQGEAGIAQMREGLATWGVMGVELYRAYQLMQLAEVYGTAGQAEAGLRVLAEARAAVPHREGRFYEAELSRLEGELQLALSPEKHAEAETCFQHTLDIARQQQAKSLELRAAMSLSRLWQRQGKATAARALLAPIYGWFTEGFDTADLREARALLEALA